MNRCSECVWQEVGDSEKARVGNYFKELSCSQEQEREHLAKTGSNCPEVKKSSHSPTCENKILLWGK